MQLRFRLLPIVVFVCVAGVGLRAADIVSYLVGGVSLDPIRSAHAETAKTEAAKAGDAKPLSDAKVEVPAGAKAAEPAPDPNKPITATPASHTVQGAGFSGAEMDLLQALAKRREELDKRDAALREREATTKVAEDRLDQKMAELTTLKTGIEKLLDLQKSKQEDQIQSLVKIYSDMKPNDAARIFSTLEMPTLLSVVAKMKEQKAAPIIAAMEQDRARELTMRLADLRQLPDGPAPSTPSTGAPTALTPAAAAAAQAPAKSGSGG